MFYYSIPSLMLITAQKYACHLYWLALRCMLITSWAQARSTIMSCISLVIIGASLSETHIDELNVRNLYIIIIIIIIIIIMVRRSPARRYRDCTGVRDIFQRMKTFAFSTWLSCRACMQSPVQCSIAYVLTRLYRRIHVAPVCLTFWCS